MPGETFHISSSSGPLEFMLVTSYTSGIYGFTWKFIIIIIVMTIIVVCNNNKHFADIFLKQAQDAPLVDCWSERSLYSSGQKCGERYESCVENSFI
jgi:hypothetical protein